MTFISKYWVLAIVAINIILGIDVQYLPPYFNPIVWRILYFGIAAMLLVFFFVRERRWFLWSCSMITAASFLRGASLFFSDFGLVPLSVHMNIVIMTWLFYTARWPSVPVKRGEVSE